MVQQSTYLIDQNDPESSATGLKVASVIRLDKIATLHRDLVRRRLGSIGPAGQRTVSACLRQVFAL